MLHKIKTVYFGGFFLRHHPVSLHTVSYAVNYWSKGEVQVCAVITAPHFCMNHQLKYVLRLGFFDMRVTSEQLELSSKVLNQTKLRMNTLGKKVYCIFCSDIK